MSLARLLGIKTVIVPRYAGLFSALGMMEAYSIPTSPPSLYRLMAQLSLPLIVDTGYDQALQIALGEQHQDWIQIQGVSRAEVRDSWYRGFAADDTPLAQCEPLDCTTLLYKPWGGVRPEGHFIVSDSDFVEVLTEIDIQTPIPQAVVTRRSQCGFVFLGCRFNDQLSRTYARQIMIDNLALASDITRPWQVNILPGCHLTPGDIEEIKEIVESFGLSPLILPDISQSLDGHIPETFLPTTLGGTSLKDIRSMTLSRAKY